VVGVVEIARVVRVVRKTDGLAEGVGKSSAELEADGEKLPGPAETFGIGMPDKQNISCVRTKAPELPMPTALVENWYWVLTGIVPRSMLWTSMPFIFTW